MRKYIFENGVGRFEDMTAEEEAAYKEMVVNSQTEATLTAEERIAQAEAKIQEALAEIEAIKAEMA